MKLDHVGIAVASIAEAAAFYRKSFGFEVFGEEDVVDQKVRVAFLKTGNALLELLEPTGSESPVRRFIDKRGPGLHHLAFETSRIEADMRRLRDSAVSLLDPEPRTGARGRKVCFLSPRAAFGTLIELVGENAAA